MWYTVAATKASYLIRAVDAPSASEEEDPEFRPPPAELAMIVKVDFAFFNIFYSTNAALKVCENNWFFRSEAHWKPPKESKGPSEDGKQENKAPPLEKTKLTFLGRLPRTLNWLMTSRKPVTILPIILPGFRLRALQPKAVLMLKGLGLAILYLE